MNDPDDLPALLAVLEVRMLADRAFGTLRPVDHYAATAPHAAAALAVLHERVRTLHADATGGDFAAVRACHTEPEPRPGDWFGGYRLDRELARGGQGVVWVAFDPRLQRTVALKLRHDLGPLSPAAAARFRREALVAARLDHPGLCPVYDAGQDGGVAWLAMRLVEGTSLQQHLATLPPPPGAARSALVPVLEQVARALHAAHAAGVVHRDVKPGNVLLATDGTPVLVDFGLASADDAGDLTRSGDRLGTPAYMAPEQLAGGLVDARTDVYALGAVAFECLVGRRPFQGASQHALFAAIEAGFDVAAWRRPRHLSLDHWAVVTTALARDPSRRYRDAAAFADDLRALHAGQPVAARPPGAWRLVRGTAARHPVFATALACAFAALGAIVALMAAANHELQHALGEARWLADARLVRSLADAVLQVPSAGPRDLPAVAAWLAHAEELVTRLPAHGDRLAALRAFATPLADAERAADRRTQDQRLELTARRRQLAAIDQRITAGTAGPRERADRAALAAELQRREALADERATWPFADPELTWQHEALADLVARLTTFAATPHGPLACMRQAHRDLQQASALAADAAHQELWRAVAAEVRDPVRCPAYRGLELVPQTGLLPLGRDPRSGLQEFAHLRSGAPARRGADGELVVDDATGVVLVLVPGGPFTPSHGAGPVELAPFFVAKHEWTQAQYLRCRGDTTAVHRPATRIDRQWLTPRHPMENVSWTVADALTRAVGLALPSEAQWEYAARGGTRTTWWFGDDIAAPAGRVNVFDAACARAARRSPDEPDVAPFDDGWVVHTEVGVEAANPFGVHDTVGNVAEWCADPWQNRPVPLGAGDGLAQVSAGQQRAIRGGSYGTPVAMAEPGSRSPGGVDDHYNTTGFRPVRVLQR